MFLKSVVSLFCLWLFRLQAFALIWSILTWAIFLYFLDYLWQVHPHCFAWIICGLDWETCYCRLPTKMRPDLPQPTSVWRWGKSRHELNDDVISYFNKYLPICLKPKWDQDRDDDETQDMYCWAMMLFNNLPKWGQNCADQLLLWRGRSWRSCSAMIWFCIWSKCGQNCANNFQCDEDEGQDVLGQWCGFLFNQLPT